jgi:hypothetical protein
MHSHPFGGERERGREGERERGREGESYLYALV